ncbi:MAG: M3 family oligoendopeptidase [Candidatus Omnitrophica bacterium]|nr:M3 family oligoendopeptidase [Candidatus Omnitrophota bacterium]
MNLNNLKHYQKRAFVPESVDLTDAVKVVDLYKQLEKRSISSVEGLKQWIADRSELDAALSETGSILYIRMTCQTDDPKTSREYTRFVQTVMPAVRPVSDLLNHKYLRERGSFPLDDGYYQIYDRSVRTDVELFSDKNVPLQTKVDLLSQEYQTLCGAMTVMFEDKEQTLPQMSKYLLQTDRSLREQAWRATSQRRIKDKDQFEQIFDQMFALRNTIAQNAGYSSFMDYQFKVYHRFDYTPRDCQEYHKTIEKLVVPLNKRILSKRQDQLRLKSLRPWDTMVDPMGKKPLAPFKDVQQLVQGAYTIFNKLDKDFGIQFKEMMDRGLLDLASRPGKAPGGYQNTLNESRKPFIFMNAVGIDDDVRTLLHEAGHAFHAWASAHEPLLDYRHAPMEFCEVASMSMELIAGEYLSEFYAPPDLNRSSREHIEGIIQTLAWVANIDAFQHWLYSHPRHTSEERRSAWISIYEQFGGNFIDWSDLKDIKSYLWHRQLHIFEVPFYYIEYGIAQLGALQVWLNLRRDPLKALKDYKYGLSLGGSRPVVELFNAAGISFDFSEKIIKPLVEALELEWEKFA